MLSCSTRCTPYHIGRSWNPDLASDNRQLPRAVDVVPGDRQQVAAPVPQSRAYRRLVGEGQRGHRDDGTLTGLRPALAEAFHLAGGIDAPLNKEDVAALADERRQHAIRSRDSGQLTDLAGSTLTAVHAGDVGAIGIGRERDEEQVAVAVAAHDDEVAGRREDDLREIGLAHL